jgi:hypothetical protein
MRIKVRLIMDHTQMRLQSFEHSKLMNLITYVPELFLPVLIFESDEIEDFDIGYNDFWLKSKAHDWGNIKLGTDDFFDHLRKIYSISVIEPEYENGDWVKFHKKCLIQKPRFTDGTIDESTCYKRIIKTMLYLNQPK